MKRKKEAVAGCPACHGLEFDKLKREYAEKRVLPEHGEDREKSKRKGE